MKTSEIKNILLTLLGQLRNKDIHGDTGYTANEVIIIIEQAIPLIQQYDPTTEDDKIVKNQTLENLRIAYKTASNYYELRYGFDTNTFRNNKIVPHMYVNRAYNAIDYFIYNI